MSTPGDWTTLVDPSRRQPGKRQGAPSCIVSRTGSAQSPYLGGAYVEVPAGRPARVTRFGSRCRGCPRRGIPEDRPTPGPTNTTSGPPRIESTAGATVASSAKPTTSTSATARDRTCPHGRCRQIVSRRRRPGPATVLSRSRRAERSRCDTRNVGGAGERFSLRRD